MRSTIKPFRESKDTLNCSVMKPLTGRTVKNHLRNPNGLIELARANLLHRRVLILRQLHVSRHPLAGHCSL